MEGFLRKKPLDGHFGRTLERRFVVYDKKLDWYDPRARPGALPKGSLGLTPDTKVERQGGQLLFAQTVTSLFSSVTTSSAGPQPSRRRHMEAMEQ